MIRYKDGNPPRDRGDYLSSYRTVCNGIVIHLFRLAKPKRDPRDPKGKTFITHTALVVVLNGDLNAKEIVEEVLSLQTGTWSVQHA